LAWPIEASATALLPRLSMLSFITYHLTNTACLVDPLSISRWWQACTGFLVSKGNQLLGVWSPKYVGWLKPLKHWWIESNQALILKVMGKSMEGGRRCIGRKHVKRQMRDLSCNSVTIVSDGYRSLKY
jgi:hypothetical protein